MPVSDGVWAGWVSKEFTRSMQAKGKMEVAQTIAKDKRNEAFNGVKVGRGYTPGRPPHYSDCANPIRTDSSGNHFISEGAPGCIS